MEEILLSDKIKDYKIDFAERDADFHMDQFHYHPYYEIYFLLSGNCSALIDHSIYHLVPGNFVLIPRSTMHRFVYDCNVTVKRYNLFFTILLLCFRTMPPAYLIPCIRKPQNRTPVVKL